jgi:hypothetical protein
MPQYQLAAAQEAQRLDAAAVASSKDAADAIERSDDYMLAVVLFATSLFFAGISSKFRSARRRETLLAIGSVTFLAAAVWVVTLGVLDRI